MTAPLLGVGMLAAATVWLATPRPGRLILGAARSSPAVGPNTSARGRVRTTLVIVASVTAAVVILFGNWSLIWLIALAFGAGFVFMSRAIFRDWRMRTARARGRLVVIEFCCALVAELQAGLPVQQVVTHACRPWPELGSIAATARLGGDLPDALRSAARRPGAGGLRMIAASWEVSGRSGAGLAAVLDRVSVALRDDEEAHAEVAAALGSPRATAKLLAGLPLLGLGLGTAMGVQPVRFLATNPIGNACLLVGISLALIGLWWVERLAGTVER